MRTKFHSYISVFRNKAEQTRTLIDSISYDECACEAASAVT